MTMTPPPITRDELPPDWIAARAEIIARVGYATRAGEGATIEVKSLRTNEWLRLTLPGGAVAFTTIAERDAVLEQLQTAPAQPATHHD